MLQAMAVLWENVCAVGQYFEGKWVSVDKETN